MPSTPRSSARPAGFTSRPSTAASSRSSRTASWRSCRPSEGSIFHPKIWALRFVDQQGQRRHRVLILSRNMTLDRSWDTALVLDEAEGGSIDAGPAAEFRATASELCDPTARRPSGRRDQPTRRQPEHCSARRPEPFTEGYLLPIGITDEPVWPFPDSARRLLAISPFLTKPPFARWARSPLTGRWSPAPNPWR